MITNLIIRRILLGIVTIWVMSILVFFGIEILPGDIADAILGQGATEETLHAIRTELGLYRPAYVRYFDWFGGLLRGDVGDALGTGRSIAEMISIRLPTTLTLGGLTAAIAVPLSLSLGLVAAMYPGSFFDRAITFGTLIVISGPEFLIATLLVMLFAIELRWVPAVSYLSQDPTFQQIARAMFLPVMTLVFAVLAPMTRMTRSTVLNVMTSPAIEMAILKGRAPDADRALACAAERIRADRQRRRHQPRLPHHRRGGGRGDLLVSGCRQADGRRSAKPRHPRGAGMRDAVLRDLHRVLHPRRRHLHREQPPAEASQVNQVADTAAAAAVRRRFRFPPLGVYGYVCILILVFWIVVALFAPYIAPYTESAMVTGTSFAPIGEEGLLLGSDYLGRDLASRLVYGARTTLTLALFATILAFVLGVITGFVAGIAGGWTDSVISRIVDAFISFPTIMLALLIVSIFGTSLPALVCAIGFIEATRVFRISRALAVNTMTQDFVEVARARGESLWWILWNEVLPNAFVPLSTDFGLRYTFSILLLSALSFLGLGVQPPEADWGSMVKDNMTGIFVGAAAVLMPALSIFTVTLSINFLVDWNLARAQKDISDELVK